MVTIDYRPHLFSICRIIFLSVVLNIVRKMEHVGREAIPHLHNVHNEYKALFLYNRWREEKTQCRQFNV